MTEDKSKKKSPLPELLGVPLLLGMILSCASIGRPEGGPVDDEPPRFVNSTPAPGATNVTRPRIVLEFDEYIKLDKPGEKIIISPPQVQQAEIKQSGRRVTINLQDTMKRTSTYTIDFADAIIDNNEGNALEDFSFTFSTGDVIDTLVVSGVLLEASNLEPIKGMLVGLHSNLSDTAFTTLPLERVGMSDSRGRFRIRGIAPGTYRIFALKDADQNYAFTQKSEAIAFYDSLIIPRFEARIKQDTLWKDTITIDTIIARSYTHYLPDQLVLRAFTEEQTNQRLIKSERLSPHKVSLFFSAKADTLPTLKGLNFDEADAFFIEKTKRNDTIHYWIRDSLIYQMDTLALSINYLYTDTLDQLVPRNDTLRLALRRAPGGGRGESDKPSRRKRGKEKEEEVETVFLQMKAGLSSSMDVYGQITLSFDEPLASYDASMIHLKQKEDTLWLDVPFQFEPDTINIMRYNIYTDWEPKGEYEFSMDSLAFYGLYGLHTDKMTQTFKVKSAEEDYAALFFNIRGADADAYVELLDAQDKVVRKLPVKDGKADFYFLNPGKYCARLVNDRNGNGVWDTGNYEGGIQPEEVYYYWQILEPKVRHEWEQDWDIHAKPLDKQKPDDMKKQKPDEDKKNKNRQNSQQRR